MEEMPVKYLMPGAEPVSKYNICQQVANRNHFKPNMDD